MTDEELGRCLNVMSGLTADGLTRLQEAERDAVGDPDKTADLPRIRARVEAGDISCGCDECGSWDGIDRRCACGNRRVYWEWSSGSFSPACY